MVSRIVTPSVPFRKKACLTYVHFLERSVAAVLCLAEAAAEATGFKSAQMERDETENPWKKKAVCLDSGIELHVHTTTPLVLQVPRLSGCHFVQLMASKKICTTP